MTIFARILPCRESIAAASTSQVLHAMAATAIGSVLIGAGDVASALVELRKAARTWQSLHMPYDAARTALLLASCDMPMRNYLENGPPVPGPLSSGLTPPLQLTSALAADGVSATNASRCREPSGTAMVRLASPDLLVKGSSSSVIYHTVFHEGDAPALLPNPVTVNFDSVLRLACERNAEILVARERALPVVIAEYGSDEFAAAVHANLFEDCLEVVLHRERRQVQAVCDLVCRPA